MSYIRSQLGTLSSSIEITVDTTTALENIIINSDIKSGQIARVGGIQRFKWDPTSSATANGSTILLPTGRVTDGRWLIDSYPLYSSGTLVGVKATSSIKMDINGTPVCTFQSAKISVGNGTGEIHNPYFVLYGGNGSNIAGKRGALRVDPSTQDFSFYATKTIAFYAGMLDAYEEPAGNFALIINEDGKVCVGTRTNDGNASLTVNGIISSPPTNSGATPGTTLTIKGGSGLGANSSGGNLVLKFGDGTSPGGYVRISDGNGNAIATFSTSGVTFAKPIISSRKTVTTSPSTLLSTDSIVLVYLVADESPVIYLPESPVDGQTCIIEDYKGDAGINNITIIAQDGSTIDGESSVKITNNFGSYTMVYDDNDVTWSII